MDTQPRKTARTALIGAVLALMLSPCAWAATGQKPDHSRWLHFMGQRASAHAIDMDHLQVLDDGLLASATRYPRTSAAGWTDTQNRKGYYEYIERLIDCHTGLSIDVAISLLDRHNQPVARRTFDRDHQIEEVALRWDQVARHKWPDRSETWLACAAAAHPDTVDDAHMPDMPEHWFFDIAKVGDAPPSDMRGAFERLRKQYQDYRAGYLALLPASLTQSDEHAAAPSGKRWHAVDASYHHVYLDMHSLQTDGHGVIEYVMRTNARRLRRKPDYLPNRVVLDARYMVDCRNGLSVPVEQTFHARAEGKGMPAVGKTLLHRAAPVLSTLASMAPRRRNRQLTWTQWLGPNQRATGIAAHMCRVAARRCGATPPAHPFEIDPAKLAKSAGPALLESARAQWLHHRATFVPACTIQPE